LGNCQPFGAAVKAARVDKVKKGVKKFNLHLARPNASGPQGLIGLIDQ
jgi:hypothetical protein